MSITLRQATLDDVPALQSLIARSARGLSTAEYRPAQVEGALRGAFGVDTQLVNDQTYFVAEANGAIVGCGGWSFRSTLFGSDARGGRDSSLLDPKARPPRSALSSSIPSWARRGIGTLLLERCEAGGARPRFLRSGTHGNPAGGQTVRSPRLRRLGNGALRGGCGRKHRVHSRCAKAWPVRHATSARGVTG